MIGFVLKTMRPPTCPLNGYIVQALQFFAHGIEPKVRERRHPPYMALVDCDSLDFDDSITDKFPQGKMSQEEHVACRTGANAVTLSRVMPFCVTH
jgi:hypothetical protein